MSANPKRYLGLSALAKRIGISPNTANSYFGKGLLPPHDVEIETPTGCTRGWLPETIDEWNKARPGKGGRPPHR